MDFRVNFSERCAFSTVEKIEKSSIRFSRDRICLVTDGFCRKNFRKKILFLKKRSGKSPFFTYVVGDEKFKNLREYGRLVSFLLEKGFSRKSLLIAFGGGSVCDFAGFAASTYMRGMDLTCVPTTFLAQIDASVGGKNSLDFGGFKNVLGSFRNPSRVVCDLSFVDEEGVAAAAGEIVKYFFLAPEFFPGDAAGFYRSLKKGETGFLRRALEIFVSVKMSFAGPDPRDEKGTRELLNLGHTAAHAFEYASGNRIGHSDAVLWGLRYAYILSGILWGISGEFARRAENLLSVEEPSRGVRDCEFGKFLEAVSRDKKNRGRKNRFLLFGRDGEIVAAENIGRKRLETAFRRLKDEYPRR